MCILLLISSLLCPQLYSFCSTNLFYLCICDWLILFNLMEITTLPFNQLTCFNSVYTLVRNHHIIFFFLESGCQKIPFQAVRHASIHGQLLFRTPPLPFTGFRPRICRLQAQCSNISPLTCFNNIFLQMVAGVWKRDWLDIGSFNIFRRSFTFPIAWF